MNTGLKVEKKISRKEVIEELKDEMRIRSKVFAGFIEEGTMTKEKAEYKIQCIQRAIEMIERIEYIQKKLFEW
jgi:hypothetical protein